jgi:hypothetical protein
MADGRPLERPEAFDEISAWMAKDVRHKKIFWIFPSRTANHRRNLFVAETRCILAVTYINFGWKVNLFE